MQCIKNRTEPMSHVRQPWYGGAINRQQLAAAFDGSGNTPGDFIVRDSETSPGTFVLAVVCVD